MGGDSKPTATALQVGRLGVAVRWPAGIVSAARRTRSSTSPFARVRCGIVASMSLSRGTAVVSTEKESAVKYMILSYASQQHYDGMAGKTTGTPAWSAEEFAAMGEFMEAFNKQLEESGELVETRALAAPVFTRRVGPRDGVAFVTDGPYAETEEVLAGYWIVECASFDRAVEIAGRLEHTPVPEHVRANAYADVRPLAESQAELGG
jgi:hypothetical protein